MQQSYEASDGAISEMAIVDTFTKLIFGEQEGFSDTEHVIIEALRSVDGNVALDSQRDMGAYLRALGVQEMIQLVSRVHDQLIDGLYETPGLGRTSSDTASHLASNRRAH